MVPRISWQAHHRAPRASLDHITTLQASFEGKIMGYAYKWSQTRNHMHRGPGIGPVCCSKAMQALSQIGFRPLLISLFLWENDLSLRDWFFCLYQISRIVPCLLISSLINHCWFFCIFVPYDINTSIPSFVKNSALGFYCRSHSSAAYTRSLQALYFLHVCILPCRVVFWISGCVSSS